ncbi:ras-GEF domain-containing family member 1B-B [Drosophila takahashii]|uniref:ras-GEF domain-containing family member 1B-B n=1 Tax=Drosophila takahashii TaxID=29030 RepID=UPI001CF8CAEF|nr:ras-GEF domain-containing family member 1B-B [Drosophila takahashii]
MDEDILNAVESLFGKDVKIVDCETSSSLQQEEVLLVNGVPVKLDGLPADDASAIKAALLEGQMPAVEHLNQLLFRAGLAQQPIEVETSLTVKSSLTTTEEVLVSRNGQILDERTVETKENFNHQSHQKEIWHPVKQQSALARATPENALKYSNSTFASQATDSDERPADPLGRQLNQTFSNASLMSSSSAITGSDQVIGSVSSTTIGDKSSNISSCDSGHDGLFHSVSMNTPWSHPRDTLTDSLYCDISSSADEADAVSILNTHLQITEPSDCQTALVYAKDMPKEGSLDSLVSLLINGDDADVQFSLLTSARLFLPPHELLSKLIANCQGKEDNLVRLLSHWLIVCPGDFLHELMLQELEKKRGLKGMTAFLDGIPQSQAQRAEKGRNHLKHLLTKQPSASSLGRQSSIKSLKRFAANVYKTDNVINNCSNVFELAHQLYAIEYAYLSQIRLEEFVEALAKDELKSCINQTKAGTLGSNHLIQVTIDSYVQWFNQLSFLTATEVLKLSKKSQRAQMIDFWVETALECFNTGNFNSLMAILTALNLTAIARLKKTWAKVQTTKFEGLEHQMDPSSNFLNYRSTMKAAIWRAEREKAKEVERAIIPFFSLFLKDLHAINESQETKLANGNLNFEKCLLLGSQLRSFSKWQEQICPYGQQATVVSYLLKAEVLTEDLLMKASYELEPPENGEEKDHYKTLKAAKKSNT